MATAIVRNHRGKGFEKRLSYRAGVPSAEKYFVVDTSDDVVAMATVRAHAEGVPGTAYDASVPTCKCSDDYEPVLQEGQSTWIRVGYSVGQSQGSIDAQATSTTAMHKIVQSARQVEIYNDISGNPVPRTTINVASRQIVVTAYRLAAAYLTAVSYWNSILNKRNSNTVTIPGIFGLSGTSFSAVANELLALTMGDPQQVSESLLRLDYTFEFGPSGTHAYTYRDVDKDGIPTGSPVTRQVYDTVSYTVSNLWG